MKEKAEEVLAELKICPNGMCRQVIGLKIDSKEVEGRKYMRGSVVKLFQ